MKFLDTKTSRGNSMLIPVDKIKHIVIANAFDGSYEISITGEDFSSREIFDDKEKAQIRYNEIKIIIGWEN